MVWFSRVEMLGFGDQLDRIVAWDVKRLQDAAEGTEFGGVDGQDLVLIELDFHRFMGGHDGDAGTPVVDEQILEFATIAGQDRGVDAAAAEVAMLAVPAAMAGLQDDIY